MTLRAASDVVAQASGSKTVWAGEQSAHAANTLGSVLMHSDVSPIRIMSALILCLVIAVTVISLMRRNGKFSKAFRDAPRNRMRVLESIRLDQKTILHLVQIDDTEMVVACGSNTVMHAHRRSPEPE
jgi:flagellar biogenesis protein FliO